MSCRFDLQEGNTSCTLVSQHSKTFSVCFCGKKQEHVLRVILKDVKLHHFNTKEAFIKNPHTKKPTLNLNPKEKTMRLLPPPKGYPTLKQGKGAFLN